MFDSALAPMPGWVAEAIAGRAASERAQPGSEGADGRGAADGPGAAAAVTLAARLLAALAATCGQWSPDHRAQVLRELDRTAGALATARSHLLVAEQVAATSIRPGDRDFVAARARQTRTGLGQARREVQLAEALHTLPTVARAVGAGDLPVPHADALARVAARAGEAVQRAFAAPEGQAELVRLAARLPLRDFTAAVERWAARVEPESVERGHAAQRAARFLVLSRSSDGTRVSGRLDQVAGAVLQAALDSVAAAPDASRTREQANADALLALVERATSGAAGVRRTGRPTSAEAQQAWDREQRAADGRVTGVAARPVVHVMVPAETLAAATALRARRDRGAGADDLPQLDCALLDDGTTVPVSEVARFLCDSEIGRVVLDGRSAPLDVGRSERLFTPAQRRAVIIRDRGCAWNGCDVPAAYCEVHHIRWWDRDRGPTDLDNAILLCSHHHHVVHELDLGIARCAPPDRPGGGLWAEPQRYEFRGLDGQVVSRPPVEGG